MAKIEKDTILGSFKVDLDVSDLDAALEKAERLKALLEEIGGMTAKPLHVISIASPLSPDDMDRLRHAFRDAYTRPIDSRRM